MVLVAEFTEEEEYVPAPQQPMLRIIGRKSGYKQRVVGASAHFSLPQL